MGLDGLIVEIGRLARFDADGPLGAMAQAGPQPVAEAVVEQLRLAVDDLDRALGAAWHALPAAVAQLLVDVDDFPNGHLYILSSGCDRLCEKDIGTGWG